MRNQKCEMLNGGVAWGTKVTHDQKIVSIFKIDIFSVNNN
jgi:hypothetical protein